MDRAIQGLRVGPDAIFLATPALQGHTRVPKCYVSCMPVRRLDTDAMYTTTQIIQGYLDGSLTREEAMHKLHMSSYSQLLNALADRGVAPPKPPPGQVRAELEAARPILRMMETNRHGS